MKQKQNQGCREQTGGCQGGSGWERVGCKLVYIDRLINKVLMFSAGNYIQFPVINHNEKEYEKYMFITESNFCTAEINTTL